MAQGERPCLPASPALISGNSLQLPPPPPSTILLVSAVLITAHSGCKPHLGNECSRTPKMGGGKLRTVGQMSQPTTTNESWGPPASPSPGSFVGKGPLSCSGLTGKDFPRRLTFGAGGAGFYCERKGTRLTESQFHVTPGSLASLSLM